MANHQGTSPGTQAPGSTQGVTGKTPQQAPSETGVRDATYNLISVIYHALQGAETYKIYEEDVERTQDDELAQFFRQACDEEKRRAQQGKELLARHLQKHGGRSGGSQQLQGEDGSSRQQGGSSGSKSGQQSQGGPSGKSGKASQGSEQAVPGDQYGNSQESSARGKR